jgi:hypothetical protein
MPRRGISIIPGSSTSVMRGMKRLPIRIQLEHKRWEDIYDANTGFRAHFYVACSASPEPCSEHVSSQMNPSWDSTHIRYIVRALACFVFFQELFYDGSVGTYSSIGTFETVVLAWSHQIPRIHSQTFSPSYTVLRMRSFSLVDHTGPAFA